MKKLSFDTILKILILIVLGAILIVLLRDRFESGYIPKEAKNMQIPVEKKTEEKVQKSSPYVFTNTPYIVGKTYAYKHYADKNNLFTAVFIGYETKSFEFEGGVARSFPTFRTPDNYKYWELDSIVLKPKQNNDISQEKIEDLTNFLGGIVTKKPAFSGDDYYISVPKDLNIFDVVNFYYKYGNFEYVAANWSNNSMIPY